MFPPTNPDVEDTVLTFMNMTTDYIRRYFIFFICGIIAKVLIPYPEIDQSTVSKITLYVVLIFLIYVYHLQQSSVKLFGFALGFLLTMFIIINEINTVAVICATLFTSLILYTLTIIPTNYQTYHIQSNSHIGTYIISVPIALMILVTNYYFGVFNIYNLISIGSVIAFHVLTMQMMDDYFVKFSTCDIIADYIGDYANSYGMACTTCTTMSFLMLAKVFN